MIKTGTKLQTVETINEIYEGLSDTGKIMLFTYSNALWDKELADKCAQQKGIREPELVEQ